MKCKSIICLTIFSFLALGCTDVDDGNYVEPVTIYEKMNGDWGLMNLKMVDEYAKANAIEPSEQNLSTLFNYDSFKIRFSVDEKMQPSTYEVLGDVPPLFEPKGYWELSSSFQQADASATSIYLFNDVQKTILTDELRLSAVPGSNQEMEIQVVRAAEGTSFISYVFKLNAIN